VVDFLYKEELLSAELKDILRGVGLKLLIMGLPGSGKTVLAGYLNNLLGGAWFNADRVRAMSGDMDFSEEGRCRQAFRMCTYADFERSRGRLAICDFICPTDITRKIFSADITIYMDTVVESRFEDTNRIFEKPKIFDVRLCDAKEDCRLFVLEELIRLSKKI
jgi:adenylylsulfate kinase